MDNIVLIGMMGSGKSALGKGLAQALKMDFVDIDSYIEAHWGAIPKLFDKGEGHFRDIESEAARQLAVRHNHVIATGGGVILRDENMMHLKRHGLIVFIDRPLDILLKEVDTGHRPLLKEGRQRLKKIYDERIHRYRHHADIVYHNDKDEATAAMELLDAVKEAQR